MSTTFFTTLSDEALDQIIEDARKPPSIAEAERKRRHADVEANRATRERAQNRARRDDFARAAYYVLLYGSNKSEPERTRLLNKVLNLIAGAGYDRKRAETDMEAHKKTGRDDLTKWLKDRQSTREKAALIAEITAELQERAERRSAADTK